MEGYKPMFDHKIVTVWSAPNYCYRCGNVAAILKLDEHLNTEYKMFDAAPQVYIENKMLYYVFIVLYSRRQREIHQTRAPYQTTFFNYFHIIHSILVYTII